MNRGLLLALALIAPFGCNRRDPAIPPPPQKPVPDRFDYLTPYLTRDHMLGYIASLSEERRLKIRSVAPHPTGPEPVPAGAISAEADRFARKYGFDDYGQYCAVDERITIARMILLRRKADDAAERLQGLKVIAASARLKDPKLSPEEKKETERELFLAMEGLEQIKQGTPPKHLNEQDVGLVAEYEGGIEYAEKMLAK